MSSMLMGMKSNVIEIKKSLERYENAARAKNEKHQPHIFWQQ